VPDNTKEIVNGVNPSVKEFPYQLAYNVIPQVDVFLDNDYTKEEMKTFHETRKIMHSDVLVSTTCVRLPVLRAHSEAIWVETERELSVEEVRNAYMQAPGITLEDDPVSQKYPMPLFVSGKDNIYVGRIRKDIANPKGITLWSMHYEVILSPDSVAG